MSDAFPGADEAAVLRDAMGILDAWGVSYDEQPAYLGLAGIRRRRDYNRLRLGSRTPHDPEVLQRARLIRRIHDATLTLFPFSEDSANLWVQVPLRRFGGRNALEVMRPGGLQGLRQVDLAVDSQFDPLGAR